MPKKLPKNADLAAGFFSSTENNDSVETITAPAPTTEHPAVEDTQELPPAEEKKEPTKTEPEETTETKNLGGRPKKDGLKNEQFTLTMNPETYEKLRIVADEQTRGNFSALIDNAIKAYCKTNEIDLAAIEVEPQILEMYRQKQAKKSKKR